MHDKKTKKLKICMDYEYISHNILILSTGFQDKLQHYAYIINTFLQ